MPVEEPSAASIEHIRLVNPDVLLAAVAGALRQPSRNGWDRHYVVSLK
jgi:hypothetical protein